MIERAIPFLFVLLLVAGVVSPIVALATGEWRWLLVTLLCYFIMVQK